MLNEPKVQKLSENKYLLIIRYEVVRHQTCKQEKDNILLYEKYLIELPMQCK